MSLNLIIIGAGGFAAESIWVAEEMNLAADSSGLRPVWHIVGVCVYDPSKYASEISSYPVLGTPWDAAAQFKDVALHYICGIGDNRIREREVAQADSFGWQAATLIHPSCAVARSVTVGPGTYIAAGAVVCPNVKIGSHVIVNNHVSVGHDSVMRDFSQACPGVRISGRCDVGSRAFLGTNATLIPDITVGERAVVGAGSVVIRSTPAGVTVAGVPAKVISAST